MSYRSILLLLVFAGLCFVPGLKGPFIHDDMSNLSRVLISPTGWRETLDAILSNDSGPLKRPIANASFLANYWAFGDSSFAFKSVSLVLHIVCGWLIYLLGHEVVQRALPKLPPQHQQGIAIITALIWVAHPLNISTVLYVVQRMTILSAIFSLSALWLFTRHMDETRARPHLWEDTKAIAAFFCLTVFSILSKENGALTPLLAGGLALSLHRPGSSTVRPENRFILGVAVALPAMVGFALVIRKAPQLLGGFAERPFTLAERLASESVILWKYLGNILLPTPNRLHFFWDGEPIRQFSDPAPIAAIAGWVLASCAAILLRRRTTLPLFALAWYLIAHAMESSFLPLELAYEHRNYLPMFGPILLATVLLYKVGAHLKLPLQTTALAALALLMALSGIRAFTWSTLPRLAAHEIETAPESTRAQFNAYNIALSRLDWPTASRHLEKIRALQNHAGWVETIPIIAYCLGDPHPVEFQKVTAALRADATDVRITRGLPQLLEIVSSNSCLRPLPFSLDAELVALGEIATARGKPVIAADYFYMAASLAWARADLDATHALLSKAIKLAPTATEPLEQLITLELTRGNTDEAQRALDKARQIWETRQPWRLYRYSEWEREIATVSASRSTS